MPDRPIPSDSSDRSPGFRLPAELHLLFVGAEEPSWTLLTLELDRRGCVRPRFRWFSTLAEGAQQTSRERFDCIVIDDVGASPAAVDADASLLLVDQLAAIRAAGCEDPVLVLSDRVDDAWLEAAATSGFELLVTPSGWRSAALVPWIHCTMQRHVVVREREEIGAAGRRRLERESGESWQLLEQRQATARRLHDDRPAVTGNARSAESRLAADYRELLRASVVAGAAALEAETIRFTRQVAESGLRSGGLLELHVSAVESLLAGLGSRSSRHVVQQTDLLLLELLCRLADDASAPPHRRVSDQGVDLLRDAAFAATDGRRSAAHD